MGRAGGADAVGGYYPLSVSVYAYSGGAGFSSATVPALNLQRSGYSGTLICGDVSGDGIADIIVGDGSTGGVVVHAGGPSAFYLPLSLRLTLSPDPGNGAIGSFLDTVDANGDGTPDLIVGGYGLDRAYVLFGGAALKGSKTTSGSDVTIVGGPGTGFGAH